MRSANETALLVHGGPRRSPMWTLRRALVEPDEGATRRTLVIMVTGAGLGGAALTVSASSGAAGSTGSLGIALGVLVAIALGTLFVTAPDPLWAPGRSERVLRALIAAPLVGATLHTAVTLLGGGPAHAERVAAAVAVLTVALLLLATSTVRRHQPTADWSPPLHASGAAHMPPLCRAFKRLVDITFGLFALLLTLPVLVVAALAVKWDSKGPWLFRQTRIGAGGQRFTVLKLRTMHVNNDSTEHEQFVAGLIRGDAAAVADDREGGEIFKLAGDPRITKVGRVLRRLSIDELPQLFNVLSGTMSLVGPRPPLPNEVSIYAERDRQRLAVKPGMTGLWQVSGRSRLSFDEMVELDIRYWTQWTPLLELGILARTPRAALFGRETA